MFCSFCSVFKFSIVIHCSVCISFKLTHWYYSFNSERLIDTSPFKISILTALQIQILYVLPSQLIFIFKNIIFIFKNI